MSVFNSVGTPLVVLMVILMIGGAIFGTAISDADYLNPATSNAEANQIIAETNHQQTVYRETERLAKAQTDAQIQAIELERQTAEQQAQIALEYERQHNEKKLVAYENFMQMVNMLIWAVGIAVGIAIVLVVGLKLGPIAIATFRMNKLQHNSMSTSNVQSFVPPLDPWESREFRKEMVKQARKNEMVLRQVKDNQVSIKPFSNPSNIGTDQWSNLPWAK